MAFKRRSGFNSSWSCSTNIRTIRTRCIDKSLARDFSSMESYKYKHIIPSIMVLRLWSTKTILQKVTKKMNFFPTLSSSLFRGMSHQMKPNMKKNTVEAYSRIPTARNHHQHHQHHRGLVTSRGWDDAVVSGGLPAGIFGMREPSPRRQSTISGVSREDGATQGLKDILVKESEHERSTYEPPPALSSGPPEPFTLTEMQGDTLMTLTRTFGSDETVSVDIMIQDDGMNQDESLVGFEDEETGEIEIDVSVNFIVSVSKRGSENQELVFECSSDGSFMEIQRVSLEPEDEEELEEGMYTGPLFDELDDAVQEALYSYLEERGITPELGEYLLHLMHDKEQREYMDWLDKMTAFL